MLLALLLFPLPWVEIQCPAPNNLIQKGTTRTWQRWRNDPLSPLRGESFSLFTQSGAQAVAGSWSNAEPVPEDEGAVDRMKRETFERNLNAHPNSAPWLALYPVLLLVGAAVGFWSPLGRRRRRIVAICAGAALLLALVPLVVGFPLENSWYSITPAEWGEEPPADPEKARLEMRSMIRATGWYWFAQAALVGCLLVLLVEWRTNAWSPPSDT
jgi:hypothetical protein